MDSKESSEKGDYNIVKTLAYHYFILSFNKNIKVHTVPPDDCL